MCLAGRGGHSLSICHVHCRGECLYQPPEKLRILGSRAASSGMVGGRYQEHQQSVGWRGHMGWPYFTS